jgi:hypothetical protein
MFCSGCGHALEVGQPVCPQCGRPVTPAAPPVPGYEFQLASYSNKVRTLGIFWIVYAGFSLIAGFVGLSFAKAFMAGGFEPWTHGSMPPTWIFPAAIHFAWIFLVGRVVLCAVAGWGLMEHTEWGRIVAIVAAILCLIKIPFGTALGIATLVILLGYRNTTLYQQL